MVVVVVVVVDDIDVFADATPTEETTQEKTRGNEKRDAARETTTGHADGGSRKTPTSNADE